MFFSHSSKNLRLIFDIGSGSIGGAAVLEEGARAPTLLATARLPISLEPTIAKSELKRLLCSSLEIILKDLAAPFRAAGQPMRVKQVDCVFAAPWYSAKTREISVSKNESFVVSPELVNELLKKEEQIFEGEAVRSAFESLIHDDLHMIERQPMQIFVNGYHVGSLYGKRGRELRMSVYMSIVPHSIVEIVEDIIHKTLHTSHLSFHSFPLLLFGAVRILYPGEEHYLLVDIAGEATDVVCVVGGSLAGVATMPLGAAALRKTLARKLSVSQELAGSRLSLFAEGNLEAEMARTLREQTGEALRDWLAAFEKASKQCQGGLLSRIFLTVDAYARPLYEETLKESKIFGSAPQLFFLDETMTSRAISRAPSVQADPFLSLETCALSKRSP
ncbi:hypothetical protein EPN83_02015 [Patescibacteria group bacterium]|nr:MAG: hypothetical protein EPN83_02015 [Patescibacteria group bacterium]